MKKTRSFHQYALAIGSVIVAVQGPSAWAQEDVPSASGKQLAIALATTEKPTAALSVLNKQIFEEGSVSPELARLSDVEMRETRGAFRSVLFDPGGWRYWNVRLEHEYRSLPPGGCFVSDVCVRIGGWHLWRAGQ